MDLNDKIKQILADKNISPSIFADEIGIQRSSMSHILAGRNKPSLDIVQKIIRRFPELGTKWILDDEDLPITTSEGFGVDRSGPYLDANVPRNNAPAVSKMTARSEANGNKQIRNAPTQNLSQSQTKRIEKILIFYTDGTFEEVKPI